MTGREVPEWIGVDADAPVPKRVKLRLLIKYGGRCYRSGHKFRPGDKIEFDHIKALCNAPPGENWNRESNLAPILGGKVHQEKTRADIDERVKTDRMRAKHLGLWPKGQKIQSRGFDRRRPA
jgi:5-methylcytosine-specific restriction protein A